MTAGGRKPKDLQINLQIHDGNLYEMPEMSFIGTSGASLESHNESQSASSNDLNEDLVSALEKLKPTTSRAAAVLKLPPDSNKRIFVILAILTTILGISVLILVLSMAFKKRSPNHGNTSLGEN